VLRAFSRIRTRLNNPDSRRPILPSSPGGGTFDRPAGRDERRASAISARREQPRPLPLTNLPIDGERRHLAPDIRSTA
jgi:hypothetical protein